MASTFPPPFQPPPVVPADGISRPAKAPTSSVCFFSLFPLFRSIVPSLPLSIVHTRTSTYLSPLFGISYSGFRSPPSGTSATISAMPRWWCYTDEIVALSTAVRVGYESARLSEVLCLTTENYCKLWKTNVKHLGRLRRGVIKLCGWDIANSFYYERKFKERNYSKCSCVQRHFYLWSRIE